LEPAYLFIIIFYKFPCLLINKLMENISILDQIISNQKAEEVAKLNTVEIVNNLFTELSERERDILSRRFSLHGKGKETLENVGGVHSLTRERIRQIETSAIKKLRQLKNLEEYVDTLKKVISQLLEEHGGLMEKEYLLDALVIFSANGESRDGDLRNLHKSHIDFLISKLLHQEFEEANNLKHFKNSYKLKYQVLDHLEELAQDLFKKIQEAKKVFKTHELIDLLIGSDVYDKHKEKFDINYNIDLSNVLGSDWFEEKMDVINTNKILYSLLRAHKNIGQNKLGHWGVHDWRDIRPKTINDKIYLVLKNHGKPMHFTEIANKINKISFDKKKANAATVHNELILDKKYVLVGRGLYGLNEWGYKKGTVSDVIVDVLKEAGAPLDREEIIKRVLDKRLVKKTTIVLALMDKDIFKKIDGKYELVAQHVTRNT